MSDCETKIHAAKMPKVKKTALEMGQQTSKEALDSAVSASISPHPWVFDMFFLGSGWGI